MNIERMIRAFAGSLVLLSPALGVQGSPLFHLQGRLAFTAFVGVTLLQYGFTKVCPPRLGAGPPRRNAQGPRTTADEPE